MLEQGVGPIYVNTLQRLYEAQKASVQINRGSSSFNIERGAKQGGPVCPILFNDVLEYLRGDPDFVEHPSTFAAWPKSGGVSANHALRMSNESELKLECTA